MRLGLARKILINILPPVIYKISESSIPARKYINLGRLADWGASFGLQYAA